MPSRDSTAARRGRGSRHAPSPCHTPSPGNPTCTLDVTEPLYSDVTNIQSVMSELTSTLKASHDDQKQMMTEFREEMSTFMGNVTNAVHTFAASSPSKAPRKKRNCQRP